jgi:RNA polymerase sigma-70 factor, ECF subfamily
VPGWDPTGRPGGDWALNGSEETNDVGGAEGVVSRARGGDEDAFAQIVSEHTAVVFRILASQVGAAEAEDATQEVFLRVHRGLSRFRGDARLGTWIHRIATNVGLQRIRNKRRRPLLERLGVAAEPRSSLPGPAAEISAEERRDALRRALEELPAGQRAVVVLRMQGIPFEQIAQTLGIRRPTAESRMARGKDRLRVLLVDWLSEGGS